MIDVMKFFGYANAASFKREWTELTDADKTQLKAGIADGSLTY